MLCYVIPPQWAADPGGGLFVVPLAGLGWCFPLAVVLGYPRRDPGGVGAWERRQRIRKKEKPRSGKRSRAGGLFNIPGNIGIVNRRFYLPWARRALPVPAQFQIFTNFAIVHFSDLHYLEIFSSSNRTATGKIRMQNSVILSPLPD